MTKITFEIDASEVLAEFLRMRKSDRVKMMRGVGSIIEGEIKLDATIQGLVKSGRYRNSVHFHDATINSVVVSDGVDYGIILNDGSQPHVITPKFKKALAFPRSGARMGSRKGTKKSVFKFGGHTVVRDLIVVKKVYHPGTPAYRTFEKGLFRAEDPVVTFVGDFLLTAGKPGTP